MKTQQNNLLLPLTKEQVKKLTTQVPETLATEPKLFTSTDLWNIQRRRKTFSLRTRISVS